MTRKQAYKKNPALAKMTDFLVTYENTLKKLHKKYQKETKEKIGFLSFVDFIYHNAQDLVLTKNN
jgi:hypothetical protein